MIQLTVQNMTNASRSVKVRVERSGQLVDTAFPVMARATTTLTAVHFFELDGNTLAVEGLRVIKVVDTAPAPAPASAKAPEPKEEAPADSEKPDRTRTNK